MSHYNDPEIEREEEQEMSYYMNIVDQWTPGVRPLYLFIDEIMNGFNGDYSERVPDEFFERVYRFCNEDMSDRSMYEWIRMTPNTDPVVRRLYAFWKTKCEEKFVKRSIRCFMVVRTIEELGGEWYRSLHGGLYNLIWNKTDIWYLYNSVQNENDLVVQLKDYWYKPKRHTSEYIKLLLEPYCEN